MFFESSVFYVVVKLEISLAYLLNRHCLVDRAQQLLNLVRSKIGQRKLAVVALRKAH